MPNLAFQESCTDQDMPKLLRSRFMRFLGQLKYRPRRRFERGRVPLLQFESITYNSTSRWSSPSRSSTYVQHLTQSAVFNVLSYLHAREWETYVVGGTLRDLMVGSPQGKYHYFVPRDIDLVVLAPSIEALEACFPKGLIRRRTRFGGLHLVKEFASGFEVHFDVWPLSETWAFKEYGIEAKMLNFPSTPFLNLDAIAIEVFPKRGSAAKIYEHGFFKAVASKLIDINFEPNPYPDICAIRSLITAAKLHFSLSRKLALFICSRANMPASIDRWHDAQISHYGQVRCSQTEIDKWLVSLKDQLSSDADRIEVPVSDARQMSLWDDHPPMHLRGLSDVGTRDTEVPHQVDENDLVSWP